MKELPNIIFIVADTMRKDAISLYNKSVNTPNIEKLAEDSIIFNNAIASAPWTVPSHASMFTGKYPSEHGLHETKDKKLGDIIKNMNNVKYETISEYLKSIGYTTIGFSANNTIGAGTGFDRGFDIYMSGFTGMDNYISRLFGEDFAKNMSKYNSYPAKLLYILKNAEHNKLSGIIKSYAKSRNMLTYKGSDDIINMLETSSWKTPFFLFINLMEMHGPYFTNCKDQFDDLFGIKPIKNAYVEKSRLAYYRRSSIIDNFIGRLVDILKKTGIYTDTLVIFTSDHGQALHERNFQGHGIYLYDELTRIPLIIKLPHKYNKHYFDDAYVSNTEIYSIIKNITNGNTPVQVDSSRPVFSESYGIFSDLRPHKNYEIFSHNRELMNAIDIPRKAIYYKDSKLVISSIGEIEEYMEKDNTKPDNIKPDPELLDELNLFTGNESFVIPSRSDNFFK